MLAQELLVKPNPLAGSLFKSVGARPKPPRRPAPSRPDFRASLAEIRCRVAKPQRNTASPLSLAHQLLSDDLYHRRNQLSRPGPSNYVNIDPNPRESIYDELITTFAEHPHHLEAVASLLSRQLSEGVEISTRSLTTVLKLALDSQDPQAALPLIQKILPALPESMDLHLLTLVVSALIKSAKPPPAEIEKLLSECLASQGYRTFEDWPMETYDLLMQSYRGNFQGGLELLKRLRPIHLARTSDGCLKKEQTEALARPYITLMDIWINDRQRRRLGLHSSSPGRLADSLIRLLHQSFDIPLEFVNVWMNAERLAGNHASALSIGSTLLGRGNLELLCGKPEDVSYTTLWKSFKSAGKAIPRPLVGEFLSDRACLTTKSLNAALSASFAFRKPDRPLIRLLLDTFKKAGVPADTRTVDIAAAGMIRLWRQTSSRASTPLDEGTTVGEQKKNYAHRRRIRGVRKLAHSAPITLEEWDLISDEIHMLRTVKGDKMLLPLGQPLARLETEGDATDTLISKLAPASRPPVTLPLSLDGNMQVTIASPSELPTSDINSVLGAIKLLLNSSIIERHRLSTAWTPGKHPTRLSDLMGRTKAEVFANHPSAPPKLQ